MTEVLSEETGWQTDVVGGEKIQEYRDTWKIVVNGGQNQNANNNTLIK